MVSAGGPAIRDFDVSHKREAIMRHFWRFVRLLWRNRKERGQMRKAARARKDVDYQRAVADMIVYRGIVSGIFPVMKRITEEEEDG